MCHIKWTMLTTDGKQGHVMSNRTIAWLAGLETLFVAVGARFWSIVFPAAPEGAGVASGEHATPGDALFPKGSANTFPCALTSSSKSRSPYPTGDGSAAICRSMPANSWTLDGSPPRSPVKRRVSLF
jgi:hypothetical protein